MDSVIINCAAIMLLLNLAIYGCYCGILTLNPKGLVHYKFIWSFRYVAKIAYKLFTH